MQGWMIHEIKIRKKTHVCIDKYEVYNTFFDLSALTKGLSSHSHKGPYTWKGI